MSCENDGVYFDLRDEFTGKEDPEMIVVGGTGVACKTSDGRLNITYESCGVELGKTFQVKVFEGVIESSETTAVYNVSCVDAVGKNAGGLLYNVTTVINKVKGEVNATGEKITVTTPLPAVEMKILSNGKEVQGQDVLINTKLTLKVEIKSSAASKYKVKPGSCSVFNGDKRLSVSEGGCSKLPNVFGNFQQDGSTATATFNAFRIRSAGTDVVTYFCSVYVCDATDDSKNCKAINCGTSMYDSVQRFRRATDSQPKEELIQFIRVIDPAAARKSLQGSVCMEQHYFILLVGILAVLFILSTFVAIFLACQSQSRTREIRKLEVNEMSGVNNGGFIPRAQVSFS